MVIAPSQEYDPMPTNLDQLVDAAERIGVVGSPSSTSELALDILAGAVSKKLVGNWPCFVITRMGFPIMRWDRLLR